MRVFDNTTQAYPEILRDIIKFGRVVKSNTVQNIKDVSDDFKMKELQLYSFCVLDDSDRFATCKDPDWVVKEFHERWAVGIGEETELVNPGVAYKMREKYWKQFLNSRGQFCYTYGERFKNSLNKVITLLKKNLETRQGIVCLWDIHTDPISIGGNRRVPCSMYYNLQYRDGGLDIIYHMRSSDFHEHFRNDFTLASELKYAIAKSCNLNPGKTFMVIDSLHAYKKDWEYLNIF